MEIIPLAELAAVLGLRSSDLKARMEKAGFSVYHFTAKRRYLKWEEFLLLFEQHREAPAVSQLVKRVSAEERRRIRPRVARPQRPDAE